MILTAKSNQAGIAPQTFRVTGTEATIGRGADCDWTLADPTRQLSKRHCRLIAANGGWRVTDLSSNGMTLNDRAVTPGVSHPVQNGDRLGMGAYDITLSIEHAYDGPPDVFDRQESDSPFGDGRQGGRLVGDPFVSPNAETITDPFDVALPAFFEDRDDRPRPATGGSVGDDVSALHQPFEPPRPGHLLLPDDWDEPLHGDAAPAEPVGRETLPRFDPPPAIAQPVAPVASAIVAPPPAFQEPAETPFESPFATRSATSAAVPAVANRLPETVLDTANVPRPAAAVIEAAPVQTPTEPAPLAASAPSPLPAAVNDDPALRAFAAFARGAGLEGAPQGSPEEALEKLGRAFRAYVVGLRRLLIARATVKGEFRIDRTMIRPFGNNPIKFATDDDDAMAALLGIGRQVGMSAEQAVADSIRDVRTHELALNQAFHHGVKELLAELSPDQVASELPPSALDALPVLRNSRSWKAYQVRHARLQASLETSLDGVFGQAFARGYEAALSGMAEQEPDDAPARTGRRS